MRKESAQATLGKFAEAVNFDLDQAVAPNSVDHDPADGQVPGSAGYRMFFSGMRTPFPDMAVTPETIVQDEDTIVFAYTITGTQNGPLGTIPPIGSLSYSGQVALMLNSRDAFYQRFIKAKASTVGEQMSLNHGRVGRPDAPGLEFLNGLYSYALVLTRNPADAEDLVQETYVRAMPAMGKLRQDSNIKNWLFTILRNIRLNQLRKLRNGPQLFADGVADSIVEPSKNSHDLYVNKLESERVRAAIQELPVQLREIILLREYEGLSYHEIAGVLDCPVGTVMSRLGRARAKLRTLLDAR
ncbi:sigma-70 family RNA polymerase sigma factor [Edaphobacter aggregans]|uniref:sigma-70 family RNA polymerase sigma factor n=1 Tax=Edaphobacter aggregans TaxID=570835 RepID=UPI00146FD0E8|nr:sigma-70 family RNA polymerase sigma factor [Edaphobacter aggregans]